MKHAHLPSDPLSCPWRLGLELIGYREVEKVYERFPLSRAVNPLLFHSNFNSFFLYQVEDLFLNSTSGYRCYDIMAEVVGRPTKGELHGPVKPPDMGHWQYQACTSLSKQVFDSFIFSVCAAILRAVVTMMFFDI